MKIAYNIQWSIDMEEVCERLDGMTVEAAAKTLEVPVRIYANMTTKERHDYAYDKFHHCPAELNEFMVLPSEVEIPENLVDYEDIRDWLSDKFGYCHEGFGLKEKEENTKGKWVWVVTPESTPALSRVFSNQEDAENCFREMVKTYGLVDFGESEDARIEEALASGYFRGVSQNKNDHRTHAYTLNSFMVE